MTPTTYQPGSVAMVMGLVQALGANPAMAQTWQPIPLVSAQALAQGVHLGGEGGQWFRDLQISRTDPGFLMLSIDVGGLYRSLDGGLNWQPANQGYLARGSNALAIDPRNPHRVISVAGNSLDWNPAWGASPNGLYLSTDQAASWKQVLPRLEGEGAAHSGNGGAVAFDPSSYDPTLGYCKTVYFAPRDGGLFRSSDGGLQWQQIGTGFGYARMAITENGTIFLAGDQQGKTLGLYRSTDGGLNFTRLRTEPVVGLDWVQGKLFISGDGGVRVSGNQGQSFTSLPLNGLDRQNSKPVRNIMVSPADPKRMAAWIQGDNWQWRRFVSSDSGVNWQLSSFDNSLAFLPYNVRQGYWAWHPTDPQQVYSVGGDWATRSTDGGKTFAWYGNGYNGIMVGRSFNFSLTSPDTVSLFFQDYNGATTRDGGKTWEYHDVSGKGWGGYCYGGYTPDGKVIFGGDAPSWGGPRQLRVSHDGGKTWQFATDSKGQVITLSGFDVGYSDPTNPDICFSSNWRSGDRGKTWHPMSGCEAVFISDPANPQALLGRRGGDVVRSTDGGLTWSTMATVPGGGISDMALDPVRQRLYVVSQTRLKVYQDGQWITIELPLDSRGGSRVESVAVDPVDPAIVYVAGPANVYMSDATVLYSTDAGQTWTNLTLPYGPREVAWVRVHPLTRELWVNGQCFGMWKLSAPAAIPEPAALSMMAAGSLWLSRRPR